MTEVRIRDARADDAVPVAALWTEAFVVPPVERGDPYDESDFAESRDRGRILVAQDGGAIVGSLVVVLPAGAGSGGEPADEAEISRLVVTQGARRRGIARALMTAAHRAARDAGYRGIWLWTRPVQKEGHRLYESLGYERRPERDSIDALGLRRLVYILELEPTDTSAPVG